MIEETKAETEAFIAAAEMMPDNFAFNAASHFLKALRKHPRFADALFDPRERWGEVGAAAIRDHAEACLHSYREAIKIGTCDEMLTAKTLLLCEVFEAYFANTRGDAAACVEELYDAVAVLMRMIAVVEGKQKLGGEK